LWRKKGGRHKKTRSKRKHTKQGIKSKGVEVAPPSAFVEQMPSRHTNPINYGKNGRPNHTEDPLHMKKRGNLQTTSRPETTKTRRPQAHQTTPQRIDGRGKNGEKEEKKEKRKRNRRKNEVGGRVVSFRQKEGSEKNPVANPKI